MLERIRRTIGEYNFAGPYQQARHPRAAAWSRRRGSSTTRRTCGRIPSTRRAGLGHRQQGKRAQRFQRVHELGHKGQEPLSLACPAQAHGISRAVAGGARAARSPRGERRADRGQGLGHPADPGAGARGIACGHPLPAAIGQNHAHARPDRPAPPGGGMVKTAWVRSYAANERPDNFERLVQNYRLYVPWAAFRGDRIFVELPARSCHSSIVGRD